MGLVVKVRSEEPIMSSVSLIPMNAAVRNLTAFYSVGLIDLKDSILTDNGTNGSVERHLYRPFDGVHYNALGYLTLANLICDNMLIYMQNHLDSYND